MEEIIKDLTSAQEYMEGFVTEVDQEYAPKGLSEDIIRQISAKKGEPDWLLEFRFGAFRRWQQMTPPFWGHLRLPRIDFQDIIYWAAPKRAREQPGSILAIGRPARNHSSMPQPLCARRFRNTESSDYSQVPSSAGR